LSQKGAAGGGTGSFSDYRCSHLDNPIAVNTIYSSSLPIYSTSEKWGRSFLNTFSPIIIKINVTTQK
jgi:hypothetical protein